MDNTLNSKIFVVISLILPAMVSIGAGKVIYVDDDATGANDGSTWADAYCEMQSALSAAETGDEIWVAAGTYKPTVEVGGSGDRYKAFQLKNGVGVYGGFTGQEISREQRNWQANETILSGDLLGNDNDNIDDREATRQDNCYHVIYHPDGTNLNETAILDGFTVKGGNANGAFCGPWAEDCGGGIYNGRSSKPTLANCIISGNSAYVCGGGVDNEYGALKMTNCTVSDNLGEFGGGIYNTGGILTMTNCTVSDNSVPLGRGGGLFNSNGGTLTMMNCTVSRNSADSGGGGICNSWGTLTMMNCTVSGNWTKYGDGGGVCNDGRSTMTNCTVSGNWGASVGGVSNYTMFMLTMTNCTVSANSASFGTGGIFGHEISLHNTIVALNAADPRRDFSGTVELASSHNFIGDGRGLSGISDGENGNIVGGGDPLFVRNPSPGADGQWCTEDDDYGDLHLQEGSPCVDAGANELAVDAAGGPLATDLDGWARIVGAVVDIGAYEYNTEITDLRVSHVSGPVAVQVDEMFSIHWIVCYCGDAVAPGIIWQDEVRLSADSSWGGNDDLVLGTVAHVSGLGARVVYTASLDVNPPAASSGIPEGDYYILVGTDSTDLVAEADESNNTHAAGAVFTVGISELVLDQPMPGLLPANHAMKYYVVNLPDSGVLRVVLDDISDVGCNELYIRYGEPPTRATYDYRYTANLAPDQEIIVPDAIPGTYYVMVYGAFVPDAPGDYTITASLLPFIITSIDPNAAGNGGKATVRIRGASFDDEMTVALVSPTGQRITAEAVHLVDSSDLWATFELVGAVPELHDVEILASDGTSESLYDAFTVLEGGQPHLWVDLGLPSALRAGRRNPFTVTFGNHGSVDAFDPVVWVDVPLRFSVGVTTGAVSGHLMIELTEEDCPFKVLRPGESRTVSGHIWASDAVQVARISASIYGGADFDKTAEVDPYFGQILLAAATQRSTNITWDDPSTGKARAHLLLHVWSQDQFMPSEDFFVSTMTREFPDWPLDLSWSTGPGAWGPPGAADPLWPSPSPGPANKHPWGSDYAGAGLRIEIPGYWVQVAEGIGDRPKTRDPHNNMGPFVDLPPGTTTGEPFYSKADFLDAPAVNWRELIDDARRKADGSREASQTKHFEMHRVFWYSEINQTLYPQPGVDWGFKVSASLVPDDRTDMNAPVVRSWDPNKKIGPAGHGAEGFVRAGGLMPYTIYFENDANMATAPAQEVRITDTLGVNLDWSTFELTEIAFRDHVISVPAGLNYYATTFDLRPYGENLLVEIEAGLDPGTGEASWSFVSLDPNSLAPPDNPFAGFLPVNDETGRGEGHVSYIIRPLAGLPTGTEIRNVATIIFDTNPPITTNQVDPHDPTKGTDPNLECVNTIDSEAPASRVNPLPALIETAQFMVSWTGQDSANGSGIGHYDIYVCDNGGNYALRISTREVNAIFTGEYGHTYRFYSVAIDNVGNREAAPPEADTETTIIECFPSPYSTYNDWVALGRPECWCAPYQCDGDADGATELSFNYRVYGKDLGLIVDNWKRKSDDPLLDPCADIDHKSETIFRFRVYGKDLAKIVANWKKKDAELAGDCPRLQ